MKNEGLASTTRGRAQILARDRIGGDPTKDE